MLDGEEKVVEDGDIWQGGNSNKLNFRANLTAGNHILEIYGAEGCCDGETSWKFFLHGDTGDKFGFATEQFDRASIVESLEGGQYATSIFAGTDAMARINSEMGHIIPLPDFNPDDHSEIGR